MTSLLKRAREARAQARQAERDMRARTRYACFVWNQLGRYPADQAVTCWYKVPQAAQRAADRLNRDEPNTYVVRSMTLPPFPAQDTKETAP